MEFHCSRCGSSEVVPEAQVVVPWVLQALPLAGSLLVRVHRRPDRALLTKPVDRALHVRVCASCGVVEWFVDDAHELYEAHQARSASLRKRK